MRRPAAIRSSMRNASGSWLRSSYSSPSNDGLAVKFGHLEPTVNAASHRCENHLGFEVNAKPVSPFRRMPARN